MRARVGSARPDASAANMPAVQESLLGPAAGPSGEESGEWMKRDWEVVRAILMRLEELGDAHSGLRTEDVTGFDAENVAYHMAILSEAGLIDADVVLGDDGFGVATRMTWSGHELLDHMRDSGTWNRVKKVIREKGIGLSLDAIKLAGGIVIKQALRAA